MKCEDKNNERYLSTGGLMEMLGISRSTVYRLMAKGMPNVMVGSVHRFPIDAVIHWLEVRGDNRSTPADDRT
jgi:excisionase family DNA binding protein